jgi:serine/threonine protein kinase
MPLLHVQGRELRVGGPFIIGRAKTCNLAISDGSLSREHARIWPQAEDWLIEDLHSANGTTVNGRAIVAGPVKLGQDDVITVGDITLRFVLPESPGLELATEPEATPVVFDPRKLPGTTLAGYAVQTLERQEVAGPLFRATHARTGRPVLLWTIDPRIESQEDADFFRHFTDTLTTAAGLKHPDLIRVYQVGREQGLIWYATEPAAGSTLAQLVHQGFTPARAIATMLSACRLLHAYHESGLVHGDLKPALIHVDDGGRVRLGSFGLAGLNSANRRMLQAEGATRQVFYLCPVQAATGDCNVKSDLYSLGCILVQLLTGRPPFIGNNFQEVLAAHRQQPLPQLAAGLGVPPLLDEILAGMLAKDPFGRYDNLEPAIRDLKTLTPLLT